MLFSSLRLKIISGRTDVFILSILMHHNSLQGSSHHSLHRKRGWARSCQILSLVGMILLSFGQVAAVSSDAGQGSQSKTAFSQTNLCDWQRDYVFFATVKKAEKVESAPCESAFPKMVDSTVHTSNIASVGVSEKADFEAELQSIVAGYPIESMVSTIAEYDRDIAGLIVGIAKKESNWGKRVPRTADGDDCFNYWGYKGAGARGLAMGHGCFGEPAEAVRIIGQRLQTLVALRQTSEPAHLTIWKCGSSCVGHSPESVRKWVSDVDFYFRAIARK